MNNEKLQVIDPADKNPNPDLRKAHKIHNVTFGILNEGHDEGAFAVTPSGILHLNNLSESVGVGFEVGEDFTVELTK